VNLRERVLAAVHGAIDEVNGIWPDLKLRKENGTTLMGDGTAMDSTSFVAFAVSVEERLDQDLRVTLSVMDLVGEGETAPLTLESLVERIERSLACGAQQ